MKCQGEQLFITKSLIVFEGAQTLRIQACLKILSARLRNINLRYQRAIQRFAHLILFSFCNGL